MLSLRVLRCVVQDLAKGSPYGTGTLNALTPQFKRIASIQGDWLFQGPRRFFLEHLAHKQNAWSFGTTSSPTFISPTPDVHFFPVSNETKSLPDLGSVRNNPHSFPYPPYPLTLVWF